MIEDFSMITYGTQVKLTNEDIDDIMCSALEGGINYWCDRAKVTGTYLGEYASEQISRGGTLKLHDNEDDEWFELDRRKFVEGFAKFLNEDKNSGMYLEYDGDIFYVDCGMIDGERADVVIQYALFGEIIYG